MDMLSDNSSFDFKCSYIFSGLEILYAFRYSSYDDEIEEKCRFLKVFDERLFRLRERRLTFDTFNLLYFLFPFDNDRQIQKTFTKQNLKILDFEQFFIEEIAEKELSKDFDKKNVIRPLSQYFHVFDDEADYEPMRQNLFKDLWLYIIFYYYRKFLIMGDNSIWKNRLEFDDWLLSILLEILENALCSTDSFRDDVVNRIFESFFEIVSDLEYKEILLYGSTQKLYIEFLRLYINNNKKLPDFL